MTTSISDYQEFKIGNNAITDIGPRMKQKLEAIKLPNLEGKEVLDIGCDNGFWCWMSKLKGAKSVLGIDRNRPVRNFGFVDLIYENRKIVKENDWLKGCQFEEMNLGKQWHELGKFDVIYMFSLYHHIYQNTGGDHRPIWFWLSRQIKDGGELIWENPTTSTDTVVQLNVEKCYHGGYQKDIILAVASEYFDYEYIGPAIHEPTREVYRFTPKPKSQATLKGFIVKGHGGAVPAFEYANKRRMTELSKVVGYWPYPGSLNLRMGQNFPWDEGYYRAKILDVVDREVGVHGEWEERWARFYPVEMMGITSGGKQRDKIQAFAFRFEGETDYPDNFVEVIAHENLGYANVKIFNNEAYGNFFDKATGEPAIDVEMRLVK